MPHGNWLLVVAKKRVHYWNKVLKRLLNWNIEMTAWRYSNGDPDRENGIWFQNKKDFIGQFNILIFIAHKLKKKEINRWNYFCSSIERKQKSSSILKYFMNNEMSIQYFILPAHNQFSTTTNEKTMHWRR